MGRNFLIDNIILSVAGIALLGFGVVVLRFRKAITDLHSLPLRSALEKLEQFGIQPLQPYSFAIVGVISCGIGAVLLYSGIFVDHSRM